MNGHGESFRNTNIESNDSDFIQIFESTRFWFGQDTRNLHPLMQQIFYELENRYTGYMTQVETLLQQLVVQIIRNYENKNKSINQFRHANLVDSKYLIIEECFLYEYRDLSLGILSKRLGLSPRQTERLLKEHYDKTFLQKKAEAKMSAASIMLLDKDKRITDIAIESGYSSVEHFSNAFKKYYKESARNYRKTHL
jgi:AraC-like DNA-binding protein